MTNSVFTFKQFKIEQSGCAMKVGTDSVLLGAWAKGGERVLDIGTGSGLIALMMAQRCPSAQIVALDIDEGAYKVFLVIELLLCTLRYKTIVKQIKQS